MNIILTQALIIFITVPIRIYSKEAKDLKLSEEKACAKLISTGAIYSLYVECCVPDAKSKNRVFIAKDGTKCIGWSVIHQSKKNFQFMVYVKKSHRRMGIATKLYNKSKNYFKLDDSDIKVYVTDKANKGFFDNVRRL